MKLIKGFLIPLIAAVTWYNNVQAQGLLIKIPLEGRVDIAFIVDKYIDALSKTIPYHITVYYNPADYAPAYSAVLSRLTRKSHVSVIKLSSKLDITAYNHNLENELEQYDMIMLGRINIAPLKNFDSTIMQEMQRVYPQFDGVLRFSCKNTDGSIYTCIPIIGTNYLKKVGYIYHPVYRTFFADWELSHTARMKNKECLLLTPIATQVMQANDSWNWHGSYENKEFWASDRNLFLERQKNNFDLDASQILRKPKALSILIPTVNGREHFLHRMVKRIESQIEVAGLQSEVELLVLKDNFEYTTGFKRNWLLSMAEGEYTCFVDDDDDLHRNCVNMLYEKIKTKPDCVELRGIITLDGKNPELFIASNSITSWYKKEGIYYRTPGHLNTIKRSIAWLFSYPNITFAEDHDWSQKLFKSKLIQIEASIKTPYYFYLSRSQK